MSFHEEEVLGKAYDARLMRRLLGYMWPYRGYVAVSALRDRRQLARCSWRSRS